MGQAFEKRAYSRHRYRVADKGAVDRVCKVGAWVFLIFFPLPFVLVFL